MCYNFIRDVNEHEMNGLFCFSVETSDNVFISVLSAVNTANIRDMTTDILRMEEIAVSMGSISQRATQGAYISNVCVQNPKKKNRLWNHGKMGHNHCMAKYSEEEAGK